MVIGYQYRFSKRRKFPGHQESGVLRCDCCEYQGKSCYINASLLSSFRVPRDITHVSSRPASITDIWAGLLSYHFLNGTTRANLFTDAPHGSGLLWSDIPFSPFFQSQTFPFPLVISDSRSPTSNGKRPTLEDIVYEVKLFPLANLFMSRLTLSPMLLRYPLSNGDHGTHLYLL